MGNFVVLTQTFPVISRNDNECLLEDALLIELIQHLLEREIHMRNLPVIGMVQKVLPEGGGRLMIPVWIKVVEPEEKGLGMNPFDPPDAPTIRAMSLPV